LLATGCGRRRNELEPLREEKKKKRTTTREPRVPGRKGGKGSKEYLLNKRSNFKGTRQSRESRKC